MKQGYTHIQIVLDRSGSMESVRNDVIGGLNAFIEEQAKVPGEATVGLTQFDNMFETVYSMVPIAQVEPRSHQNYVPRSMTALYDAIGKTIHELGTRLAMMSEDQRPSKVIFIIQTDGFENASQEYNAESVKRLIEQQKTKYSWDFVFLGANQDAILTAGTLGIGAQNAATFNATAAGVASAYVVTSAAVGRSRTSGVAMNYTPEEQGTITTTK